VGLVVFAPSECVEIPTQLGDQVLSQGRMNKDMVNIQADLSVVLAIDEYRH
jgi:hypothetical protein